MWSGTESEAGIMTELEGRELDEALVHALGWATWRETGALTGAVTDAERRTLYWGIPEWHASLDAIYRDLLPVLRERGWDEIHMSVLAEGRASARVMRCGVGGAETWVRYGPTPALALARACLAALTEGQE